MKKCDVGRRDVSPPGRAKQVEAIKASGSDVNPFAVAWASYNKSDETPDNLPPGTEARPTGYTGMAYTYGQKRGPAPATTPELEAARDTNMDESAVHVSTGPKNVLSTDEKAKGRMALHEALGKDAGLLSQLADDDADNLAGANPALRGGPVYGTTSTATAADDDDEKGIEDVVAQATPSDPVSATGKTAGTSKGEIEDPPTEGQEILHRAEK